MNELIKQLSEQAAIYSDDTSYDDRNTPSWFQFYSEKFAELIVAECASIDFYKLAHIGTEDDYNVTQAIKAHFGVKNERTN